ncbi:MAG: hypothetical protein IPG64_07130 [Haliea sp.]|nr:hypothetical protein [Haliea sp.]
MTQPKLLLHIGPHKTGTTSIQAVASHQLPAISKAGWAVETFPELKNGTHSLASLLSNGKLDAVKPHLEKLGTITTPTLISSENFSRLTEAQAKFMLNTIGISDVRVVYYLRNPLHRLLSAWTERVRHGYRRTLTEYIAGRLLQPFRDRDINDKVRITPWAHALGQTAVSSGALDLHLYDQYDDVVKHFFSEYFGIAIDDSEENTRLHVSSDAIRIEILRALHGYQTYLVGKHSFNDDLASLKRRIEIIISKDRETYIHKLRLSLDNTVMRRIETSLIEDYGSSIRQSWSEGRLLMTAR